MADIHNQIKVAFSVSVEKRFISMKHARAKMMRVAEEEASFLVQYGLSIHDVVGGGLVAFRAVVYI